MNCDLTLESTTSWLTASIGERDATGADFLYFVDANTAPSQRSGTITITSTHGQEWFTVQQYAACVYSIEPTFVTVAGEATSGSVALSVTGGGQWNQTPDGQSCGWHAISNVDWITVAVGLQFPEGDGTVVYSVAANTGTSARTGTISIADQTFTVTQDAP